MKNWDPLVSLPRLAMDSRYFLLCLTAKLSSGGKEDSATLKLTSFWGATTRTTDKTVLFCFLVTFKEASIYGLASSSIAYKSQHTSQTQESSCCWRDCEMLQLQNGLNLLVGCDDGSIFRLCCCQYPLIAA